MKKEILKFSFLACIFLLAGFFLRAGLASGTAKTPSVPFESPQNEKDSGIVSSKERNLVFFRLNSTPVPETSATEILVGDIQTGEIYFGKNEDMRWPMASITKLVTAMVVERDLDMDSTVRFDPQDFIDSDSRFTNFFFAGAEFSARDLVKAMLVGSSNESANALARTLGYTQTISNMNQLASDWGLKNTYFRDPYGISAANQSSASDLFKIAINIYRQNPSIFETTRNSRISVTDSSGAKHMVESTNQFAGRPNFLGGKTGTTSEAGENLLSVIAYGDRPVVIIVLGTRDRFADTEKLLAWFKNDFSPGY